MSASNSGGTLNGWVFNERYRILVPKSDESTAKSPALNPANAAAPTADAGPPAAIAYFSTSEAMPWRPWPIQIGISDAENAGAGSSTDKAQLAAHAAAVGEQHAHGYASWLSSERAPRSTQPLVIRETCEHTLHVGRAQHRAARVVAGKQAVQNGGSSKV